jgi:hypothetical protein
MEKEGGPHWQAIGRANELLLLLVAHSDEQEDDEGRFLAATGWPGGVTKFL